jgi:hypothetical protein
LEANRVFASYRGRFFNWSCHESTSALEPISKYNKKEPKKGKKEQNPCTLPKVFYILTAQMFS